MRLLTYNINDNIIQFMRDNDYFIIDETNDFDEALYYLNVRFYNLVLVDESNLEKCLRFLSEIESKNTAFVILTEDYSKSFELQCLQEGALDLIKKPIHENLLITKIKTIHRNNYYNYLTVDNLFYLNKEYKTISNYENNEVYIGDKAFLILKYLILNDYRRVTRDELIQVIWDEPEHVQPNTLDVHIYRLRAQLEKHFNLRIIDNITNKGYKIINQEISAS